MDEDLIKAVRERLASSPVPGRAVHAEVSEDMVISGLLLDDYRSGDLARSGIAAFRLSSFLGAKGNDPTIREASGLIASALAERLRDHPDDLGRDDLEIGILLWLQGVVTGSDVEVLVEHLRGKRDIEIARLAPQIIPIIGTGFLSSYLTSTELFETGGMGGPMRPLLREMAQEALASINRR